MPNHPVVHLEIPARDTQAASKFYADVFGWELQTDETYNYVMFNAGSGPAGGFVTINDTPNEQNVQYKPGEVLIYLGSDDIDGDLAKVTAQGGTVLTPRTEIPHIGWFAVFTDLTGNKIGLFNGQPQQG
jgi:hypothetical protein